MNHKSKLLIKKEMLKQLAAEDWLRGNECLRDRKYIECVYDILSHKKFQEMNNYIQHGTTTTLRHCLSVSYTSYKIAKAFGYDYKSTARAGLLHDLFLYDWHTHPKETGNYFHGFTHPQVALHNAKKYFDLNFVEKDIIVKHMWPLTIVPPKTMEGYIIMYADKYCGLIETVQRMYGYIPKLINYMGI